MRAFYGSSISTNQTETPEGFLICRNVPIARVGWYDYLGSEIGVDAPGVLKVYRSPDEVFAPGAMASFEGKPVCNDHPPDGVSPVDAKLYVKGAVQNVRRGQGEDADLVLADLVIYDEDLIREIRSGKRAVSAGYECEYEPRGDGTFAQARIVGNHVAVVDEARAGDRVRILDGRGGTETKDMAAAHEASLNRVADRAIAEYQKDAGGGKCDEYKDSDGKFKGGFEGAVKYFQCRGYSEEVAKKIAGKIAAEHGDSAANVRRKGADNKMADPVHSLTRRKTGPVTHMLAAIGLKHYAQDAEPEKLNDVVDAMAEERTAEETDPKPDPKDPTKDEPGSDPAESAIEKRLGVLEEMLKRLLDAKAPAGEKSAEEKIDDAIQQMQDPESTGEESQTIDPTKIDDEGGEVAPKEDRPESGFGTVDRAARIAALRAVKASLSVITDPVARQRAADAALKQITADSSTYAKIAEATRQKAKDTAAHQPQQSQDLSQLGRTWAEQRNPHYKKTPA